MTQGSKKTISRSENLLPTYLVLVLNLIAHILHALAFPDTSFFDVLEVRCTLSAQLIGELRW